MSIPPVKKRYTRTRKAPGMQKVDNNEPASSESHTPNLDASLEVQQRLVDIEEEETHEPAEVRVNSAISVYKTPSQSRSRGSILSNHQSATPSTRLSAAPQDLLTGSEQPIGDFALDSTLTPTAKRALIPVPNPTLTPTPGRAVTTPANPVLHLSSASNNPSKGPRSSRASTAFTSQSRHQQQPAWMERNPNAKAKETKNKSNLIDDAEATPSKPQPANYLAAAKRGNAAKPSGAQVSSPLQPQERLEANSEVQSRRFIKLCIRRWQSRILVL